MGSAHLEFKDFVMYFPEVELPITLDDNIQRVFSAENTPLPGPVIDHFLVPLEESLDQWTEYVPCFRIPETHIFHGIVYWKAGLMDYQYSLATFTKKGDLIDKRVIAGTYSDNKRLTKSVATIETDWMIYIASGQTDVEAVQKYEAAATKTFQLEILPEGQIVCPE